MVIFGELGVVLVGVALGVEDGGVEVGGGGGLLEGDGLCGGFMPGQVPSAMQAVSRSQRSAGEESSATGAAITLIAKYKETKVKPTVLRDLLSFIMAANTQ